jgi:hypothetical protein
LHIGESKKDAGDTLRKIIVLISVLNLMILTVLGMPVLGEPNKDIKTTDNFEIPISLYQEENVTEPQDITLYLYGTGDPAELKPVYPNNGSGNSAPPARYGGGGLPNKLAWMVGTFSTIQVKAPMTIDSAVSGRVWAKGSGQNVFFYVNLYHNNQQIKQMTTETRSVSGDTEFPFSDTIDSIDMAVGDRIELRIYAGSQVNSNFEMCWGSMNYDSHIKISCNSMFIMVIPPIIEEEFVIFSAVIMDAFNSQQLDAHITVTNHIDVVSISPPRFIMGENGSMIAWDWNYKADKAEDGEYRVTVSVCYGEDNDFQGSGTYILEFHEHEPPEDIFTSLGILFPIIIIAIIAVVAVIVVKVILNRRALKSAV